MPISLRLRGVLLRHTFVVGILTNTQRCYVLQLRCYHDDSAPEEPLHPNYVLPPLSPDPSDLSTLIEQMRLNPALQRELQQAQRNEAPAQWCGEMRLVFLVTPRTEAPLERFLNRHFCDHLVVIDGFAIAHNIDYSLVVNQPVSWGRSYKQWNYDHLDQRVYRDRYGLAILVRAIALSPLDASFRPEQPYLFFTASDCRVRNVTTFPATVATPGVATPVAFQHMLLGLNRHAYDLSLAELSASALSSGALSGASMWRQSRYA